MFRDFLCENNVEIANTFRRFFQISNRSGSYCR